MPSNPTTRILERTFSPVKHDAIIDTSHSPESMIHHKSSRPIRSYNKIVYYRGIGKRYGVSSSHRVITPGLFNKKYDRIRDCLELTLGRGGAQREVILRLLRLWAYYGYVYPKESMITTEPGCSKATFWRTIRLLEELGLIQVVNRFIMRPHAQISNLYRLDRLVVVLARYLAEHGVGFSEEWLTPALTMPGRLFWSFLDRVPGARAGPTWPAFEGILISKVTAS